MTALKLLESGEWRWIKFALGDFATFGCLAGLLVATGTSNNLLVRVLAVEQAINILYPDRGGVGSAWLNDHPDTTEADVRRVLKVAGA